MRHTKKSDDPATDDGFLRTRNAVLNALVGVGVMIAASGWLIRRRAGAVIARPTPALHDDLLFALIAVAVVSYLVRRAARRTGSLPPGRRRAHFFLTHVGAVAIAALGVPLGLVYGWFVDPSLEGVAPFWVVPLALGFLAIPRRREWDDRGPSSREPEAHRT